MKTRIIKKTINGLIMYEETLTDGSRVYNTRIPAMLVHNRTREEAIDLFESVRKIMGFYEFEREFCPECSGGPRK